MNKKSLLLAAMSLVALPAFSARKKASVSTVASLQAVVYFLQSHTKSRYLSRHCDPLALSEA